MRKKYSSLGLVLCAGAFCISFAQSISLSFSERIESLKKSNKLVSIRKENREELNNNAIVSLGEKLFNEKLLSAEKNISCSTCHSKESGFSNSQQYGTGTHGNYTGRNVPHLYNLKLNNEFFWDGRVRTLEEQLGAVITSKDEMDISFKEIVKRLREQSNYVAEFNSVFPGEGIKKHTVTEAIVAYEKTIISGESRFDLFIEGDTNALNADEKKGLEVFITKANCISCHNGVHLSDKTFHNVGVKTSDLGRHLIDKVGMSKEFETSPYPFFSSFKAFRTPTLRNIALTAPYFHDGSKNTLEEVIRMYNKGGDSNDKTGLAKEIVPLNLSEHEITCLASFLRSLTEIKNYR